MIVTPTQRETIHSILNQMLIGVRGNSGIIFLYEGNRELGISGEEGRFLRAVMQSEGLVTNADGPNQNNLSELTAKGYSIARNPGGYRAYVQNKIEQQQQQQNQEREQLELNRKSAAATVSSTRVAKASAWIAALSLVATMIATYIAYQANADSTNASARLQKLEAQVQQLKRSQTAPTARRER
jgi:hypothetical protein